MRRQLLAVPVSRITHLGAEQPARWGIANGLPTIYPGHRAPVQPDTNFGVEELLVEQLNWQESKILQLVAQGMQNGEIGKRLSLTEGTVKWYMQRIFDKLGVRRRALAVKRAQKLGLIKEAEEV